MHIRTSCSTCNAVSSLFLCETAYLHDWFWLLRLIWSCVFCPEKITVDQMNVTPTKIHDKTYLTYNKTYNILNIKNTRFSNHLFLMISPKHVVNLIQKWMGQARNGEWGGGLAEQRHNLMLDNNIKMPINSAYLQRG